MKTVNYLLSSILMMSFLSAINAQSGVCIGGGDFIKEQWRTNFKAIHPIGEKALKFIPVVGQNAETTNVISESSEELHHFIFDGNTQSWATIGQRTIPVLGEQTTQMGTLQKVAGVAGTRTFITGGMLWDRVEIEIEKLSGGLKTEVIICTWDMDSGAKNNVENYMFPNSQDVSSKKFVITNVYGKSISIRLAGKEANFDKFHYKIKTRGIVNINKQRQRAQEYTGTSKTRIQKTINNN